MFRPKHVVSLNKGNNIRQLCFDSKEPLFNSTWKPEDKSLILYPGVTLAGGGEELDFEILWCDKGDRAVSGLGLGLEV